MFFSCDEDNPVGLQCSSLGLIEQDGLCVDECGVVNGSGVLDECGVCDEDSSNDCTQDVCGVWGGSGFPMSESQIACLEGCFGDPNCIIVCNLFFIGFRDVFIKTSDFCSQKRVWIFTFVFFVSKKINLYQFSDF